MSERPSQNVAWTIAFDISLSRKLRVYRQATNNGRHKRALSLAASAHGTSSTLKNAYASTGTTELQGITYRSMAIGGLIEKGTFKMGSSNSS
jgi:hypothetical protein